MTTIPKPYAGDNVYDYQKDLMDHLYQRGVISYESIQGGDRFGMLEGMYNPEAPEGIDPVQVAMLQLERYIHETAGEDEKAEEYDKDIEDRFTDPTPEDSTAYGAIKPVQDDALWTHGIRSGTLLTRSPGYGYFY